MINPEEFVGNNWAGVWSEAWVEEAEAVINSLGLQLADVERESAGLLRVSIDSESGITVKDCEKVSHQLTHLLTVEDVSYDRLEVSSPGVDRALRRKPDFIRFLGEEVALKFRQAVQGQKNFKGVLGQVSESEFSLTYADPSNADQTLQLQFEIADLMGAKLVPHLKF